MRIQGFNRITQQANTKSQTITATLAQTVIDLATLAYTRIGQIIINIPTTQLIQTITQSTSWTVDRTQYAGYDTVNITIPKDTKTITANGTYNAPSSIAGWDEVEVDVQPDLTTLTATTNGAYTPPTGYDGYDEVIVNVPAAILTTLTATANGAYTPPTGYDGYDEVIVNVPAAILTTLTATANGTYTPPAGYNGFSSVVVNVPTGGGSTNINITLPLPTIEITTIDDNLIEIELPLPTIEITTIDDNLIEIELPLPTIEVEYYEEDN